MPDLKDVLDDVQREVKRVGDDYKSLQTSMEKDLKSVRELAESAGKDVSAQFKSDLDALTRASRKSTGRLKLRSSRDHRKGRKRGQGHRRESKRR
jgi:hypothetical protein